MPTLFDMELAKAAYKVIFQLVKVKPGESVLITIDGPEEFRVAEELAKMAEVAGAKVHVAWHTTPPGYGKVGDPYLPDSLKAAIVNTDIWIELNNQWLLYSTPWDEAMATGRVRYLFLGGLDSERMVRLIGKIDIEAQAEFQNKVVELTHKAKHMRIATPAGTDVEFDNDPKRPITNELFADTPGPHFLLGQIGWAPIEESINGVIVFDGSFSGGGEADLGVLREPIKLTVNEGKITKIEGGAEAAIVERWLKKLGDPNMYYAAHVCYGFNPGAKLTGLCTEDERVWGSTEWGFGHQGPMFQAKGIKAVSHFDGICLNSSVWLDEVQLLNEGVVVHPELVPIAKKLGKA